MTTQNSVDATQRKPKKHGTRYPWNQLFKLREFTLRKGIDYDCLTSSMRMHIWTSAKRLNVKIVTSTTETSVTVQVLNKRI